MKRDEHSHSRLFHNMVQQEPALVLSEWVESGEQGTDLVLKTEKSGIRKHQRGGETGGRCGETGRLHRAKEGAEHIPRAPGMGRGWTPQRRTQGRVDFPVSTDWQSQPQDKPIVLENLFPVQEFEGTLSPSTCQVDIGEEVHFVCPMSECYM